MTLFDPNPFGSATPEPGVPPYMIEVWIPTVVDWVAFDPTRASSRYWTARAAVDAAQGWCDAGEVINPRARVVDSASVEVWRSIPPNPMVEIVDTGGFL